jgi:glucose/arabinose dehydrogenase/PKD repeat protein
MLLLLGPLPLGGPAAAADPPPVQPYLLGLDFPVAFAFAPDGRLFYNEKYTGNIRVADVTGATPRLIATPFATVGSLNVTAEMGLLGLALDPDFANTPWLYVFHTFDNGSVLENRITRYWAANNTSGAAEDVVTGIPAWDYHNGGILQFGPDGKLWVTTGDSNNGALAPNVSYWGGKVLRFNKDGSIPADNPFPGSPVYTRGHRNVFGITFEPHTGRAFITENGELDNDEVNALTPGANYGWPWDAGFANNSSSVDPIWAITPTIAPTGIVASTTGHPSDNRTDLIFGDFNTASLRRLTVGPPGYDQVLGEQLIFTRAVSHILDLDFGPGGLLYISTPEGIYTSDLHQVGNQLPIPIIATNRSVAFEGVPVAFDATRSFDPEAGGIFSHAWEFGDGTKAAGDFVSHAFASAGNYAVRLTITDEVGAANSTTITLPVLRVADNQGPLAVISASRPVQFVDRPVGFGSAGSYDPEDGGLYSFAWQFGDGTSGNGSYVWHNFSSSGTYRVSLTVADEFGVPGTSSLTVQILALADNMPPSAVATVPRLAWAGLPENFSSILSTDAEGGIVAHVWQFGEGATSTLGFDSHAYASPGNYNGSLTVSDELGATALANFSVEVLDPVSNRPPTAVITVPQGVPKAGISLAFSDYNSSDAEGGIYRHEWIFGDGATGYGSYVTHTFASPGTYNVKLTVFDELGASGSAVVPLAVRPSAIPPVPSFVSDDWATYLGQPLFFDGSTSSDPDGYIADAYWTFDDGPVQKGLQVTHYFRSAGEHEVKFTVVDDSGLSMNTTTVVLVNSPPALAANPFGAAIAVAAAAVLVGAAALRRP